ncbi:MAG: deoxyguanosinetriphosphate triphosphohydrolase [Caldilineae bacterium]|nr:MAG: deoxyguanosinetriphosphate triphosphohydrolase [Caldilineae bacterium]
MEEQEAKTLAPYAMKSRDSRGRAYPEDEHAYRTRYQRDRDRVIHTTAFRRLEYKTQVFIITEGDYYRTRLTHTIEVAQIGRTIARALRANEDLTEAICLAHDLGHGPFGHSGEEALNRLMAEHGGFDHNHQGLRIIEKLEQRFPDFDGLNLTWEVREGMLKHETEYDRGEAFAYDPHLRGTLEAQIVNLADEIAYTTADLDDGLRSGMITPAQLHRQVELWNLVTAELGINGKTTLSDMERHRIIRRLVGKEVTSVVEATSQALSEHNIQSVDDIRHLPANIVAYQPDFAELNRELKRFLYNNLYTHWRVMRMANKAQRLITELFNAFVEDPSILPQQTQAKLNGENLHRVVCDYIAGMTDRYAIKEHERLFNPTASV